MKQYIIIEDLNLLTETGKKSLAEWYENTYYMNIADFPNSDNWFLSIGQMIEFLDSKFMWWRMEKPEINVVIPNKDGVYPEIGWSINNRKMREELCDALWSVCVDVLNKEPLNSPTPPPV